MIDIAEINDTIEELQNGQTTFDVCQKLASLFIVRNYLTDSDSSDNVISEYQDILPSYSKYIECKRNYQLNLETIEHVENAFKTLLQEIYEFLDILYVSTENSREKASILATIERFRKTRVN